MKDKVLSAPLGLDPFERDERRLGEALSRRVNADPESVERGLVQLVLTIVELLRQLMERQALRRIDGVDLSEEQIERLGTTFMELDRRMTELREQFGLTAEDLNLDLGPLGRLLQSGMFPCLRFGPATRLVPSVSSAVISFGRVSCGTITSSM